MTPPFIMGFRVRSFGLNWKNKINTKTVKNWTYQDAASYMLEYLPPLILNPRITNFWNLLDPIQMKKDCTPTRITRSSISVGGGGRGAAAPQTGQKSASLGKFSERTIGNSGRKFQEFPPTPMRSSKHFNVWFGDNSFECKYGRSFEYNVISSIRKWER